ncbi:MAG: hypothetical protein SH868_07605 [Bythopirellula sp.]|nr:hypothetical protein [Bythopirellula sp.]
MARGWITKLAVVALVGALASESLAQTGKATRKPGGSTLASRLSQIKSAFVGDNTPEDEANAYAAENRGSSPRNSNSQSANQRLARSTSPSRVQAGDLLPKGIFFDRSGSPNQDMDSNDFDLGDEVFDPSPRRGAAPVPSQTASRTPRRSPSTTRENELQDALDDLLAVEQQQLGDTSKSSGVIGALPKANKTQPSADTQNFDLRQALISKATAGSTPARSAAMNDLRQQLESLEESSSIEEASIQEDQTDSLSAPFEKPAQNIFASPTQQYIAPTQPKVLQSSRGGMLTAGGETLLNSKQPVITSRVEGPRQILVGREATYRVTLENSSEAPAHTLSAEVRIPEWAEVVDVMTTSGVVERTENNSAGVLRWQLDELSGRSAQSLSVRLIPRSGKPLQLSVEWTQAPIASQALVEVQEPMLEMKISGPQEVLYNKAQRFQLSLRNPGTGVAENVVIKLIPPGGDEASASTHTVGVLAAGASKEIELELTAREAGDLVMKASATGAGGLQSEAIRKVLCRKPELELDWRGPKEKYAGTEASYYFRVSNKGTASTEPVALRVKLPEGVKLISASEGYKVDTQNGFIAWEIAGIAAGEAEFVQITCQADRAGANRFEITAQTAGGELRSTKEIETNVIAVADLKLSVTDPQGPVPVGETALYEIRIRNRGTTDAQNVGVVGLFSAGIDPSAVEGAQFSVRDGRVSIHPINTLPAGQELVLKIRAVATQAGTHVFRAEVSCADLDIKLAAEETTKFYEDQYRWEDGETAYSNDPSAVGAR